jgi:hypothetical protein
MPWIWCNTSSTAHRAICANLLCPLPSSEADSFYKAMSTVKECNDQEELLDRKIGTADKAEAMELEKDISSIKDSASTLADFVDFTVPRMCECSKAWAQTEPVKAYNEEE